MVKFIETDLYGRQPPIMPAGAKFKPAVNRDVATERMAVAAHVAGLVCYLAAIALLFATDWFVANGPDWMVEVHDTGRELRFASSTAFGFSILAIALVGMWFTATGIRCCRSVQETEANVDAKG